MPAMLPRYGVLGLLTLVAYTKSLGSVPAIANLDRPANGSISPFLSLALIGAESQIMLSLSLLTLSRFSFSTGKGRESPLLVQSSILRDAGASLRRLRTMHETRGDPSKSARQVTLCKLP